MRGKRPLTCWGARIKAPAPVKAIFLVILITLVPFCAFAQDPDVKAVGKYFKPVLDTIFNWIFPLVAAITFLYGVVKGMREGDWGTAIVIILFAIGLAFAKPLLSSLFPFIA